MTTPQLDTQSTSITDRQERRQKEKPLSSERSERPLPALLPPISNLRALSSTVAAAVVEAAVAEGLARAEIHDALQQVHAAMWWPEYPRIEPI